MTAAINLERACYSDTIEEVSNALCAMLKTLPEESRVSIANLYDACFPSPDYEWVYTEPSCGWVSRIVGTDEYLIADEDFFEVLERVTRKAGAYGIVLDFSEHKQRFAGMLYNLPFTVRYVEQGRGEQQAA